MAAPIVYGAYVAGSAALRYMFGAAAKVATSKFTVGAAVAYEVAPTALAVLDNATGNRISETLLKTPVGGLIEAVLGVNEYSNDQIASVLSSTMERFLMEKGALDASSDNFEHSQKIVKALSHAVIGDEPGALTALSGTGLDPSDVVGAYNQAKAANPDGTLQDVALAAFTTLQSELDNKQSAEIATAEIEQAPAELVATQPTALENPSDLQLSFMDKAILAVAGMATTFLSSINVMGWADGLINRIQDFGKSLVEGDIIGQGTLGMAGLPNMPGFDPLDPTGPDLTAEHS